MQRPKRPGGAKRPGGRLQVVAGDNWNGKTVSGLEWRYGDGLQFVKRNWQLFDVWGGNRDEHLSDKPLSVRGVFVQSCVPDGGFKRFPERGAFWAGYGKS